MTTTLNKKPLLSICIPTYNRADVLKKCLDSIIYSPVFSDDIEVIISDNNSNDNTCYTIYEYTQTYSNVKYYRNPTNIGFDNFINVLELATGKFRKLHNDYSIFTSQGLLQIYNIVKLHEKTEPIILFGNWGNNVINYNYFTDLDALIDYGRITFGWIGLYGFWENDFLQLQNKKAKKETLFMQLDWFLRIFMRKKKCYFYFFNYVERGDFREPQGGYDFFTTHITKYLSIFREYYNSNYLSKITWDKLNFYVFCYMLNWIDKLFILNSKNKFSYDKTLPFHLMFKTFGKYFWFYPHVLKYIFHALKLYINTNRMN